MRNIGPGSAAFRKFTRAPVLVEIGSVHGFGRPAWVRGIGQPDEYEKAQRDPSQVTETSGQVSGAQ